MDDEIDVLGDAQRPVSDNELKSVSSVAEELLRKYAVLEDLTRRTTDLKKEIFAIEQKTLPDAMSAVGLKDFTLQDGTYIEVRDFVDAGIKKDDRAEAFKWLEENNFASLIKTEVSVSFGRDSFEEAVAFAKKLRESGMSAEADSSVHPQTLSAWAREQLAQGNTDLPFELLGIFVGKKVKVTLPNAPKSKKKAGVANG